jgi:hypothetical protein
MGRGLQRALNEQLSHPFPERPAQMHQRIATGSNERE